MVFREKNFGTATMEPEDDIVEATRKKKEENERKMEEMKERLKKREEEWEKQKEERKKKQEEDEQKRDEENKKRQEKREEKEQKWRDDESKKKRKEEGKRKKEEYKKEQMRDEETKEKREKYSKEFQRKPLNVEKVKPADYTEKMRDDDLAHLDEWLKYEYGRFDWLIKELEIETDRRMKLATTAKEMQEIRDWHYQNLKHIHKEFTNKKKEIWDLRARVINAYLYREDPNAKKEKEAEQKFGAQMKNLSGRLNSYDFSKFKDLNWKRKADEYQKDILILYRTGSYQDRVYRSWRERLEILQRLGVKIEDFLKRADEAKRKPGSGGGGGPAGPETPPGGMDGKKAEQIAIQELGITFAEYKAITGNIDQLSGPEVTNLVKKVFKINSIDKKDVKKAYYKCVKEWHPDVNGSNGRKEICEFKIKVANNLYGEYSKRFGK